MGVLIVVSRDLKARSRGVRDRTDAAIGAGRLGAQDAQARAALRCAQPAARRRCVRFDPARCASPLPRAYQLADGSAYVNHVELVRKARGAEMPASFWTDPLMYQGGSDSFIGPCDPILAESEDWGIDLEGEVAVITGRCADGHPADRRVIPHPAGHARERRESAQPDSGRAQQRASVSSRASPPAAFSPVAVTPDELGDAWDGGKVQPARSSCTSTAAVRAAQRRRRHDIRLSRS